jgi:hypothetical protein
VTTGVVTADEGVDAVAVTATGGLLMLAAPRDARNAEPLAAAAALGGGAGVGARTEAEAELFLSGVAVAAPGAEALGATVTVTAVVLVPVLEVPPTGPVGLAAVLTGMASDGVCAGGEGTAGALAGGKDTGLGIVLRVVVVLFTAPGRDAPDESAGTHSTTFSFSLSLSLPWPVAEALYTTLSALSSAGTSPPRSTDRVISRFPLCFDKSSRAGAASNPISSTVWSCVL